MNVEGNCSTSEKGENKTHLPAFLPRPRDTQRHLILCTLLLQTPHISILYIFALAYRKTAPIFQQALCSCSHSTHHRALSRQKVGLICLVKSSCLGQAFSKKARFGVTGITGAPLHKNCLYFIFP